MSHALDDEIQAVGSAPVIVVLKQTAKPKAGAAASTVDPGEMKRYFGRHSRSQAMSLAANMGEGASKVQAPAMRYYPHLGVMFGTVDRKGLAGLRANKKRVAGVCAAPRFSLIRPMRVSAAALTTPVTWGIEALGVEKLWDRGFTGKGVLVGHLDTGTDGTHPTLTGAIANFAEFDFLGGEVSPAPAAHDTDDHGTHTAATIAGRPVGGRAMGVAPGATLASAIVIEGGQVIARILGGMNWAVGQGVRVLSMSLGLRGFLDDFLPVTRILRSRNILPVFAVGNEGPGTSRSPGNYSEALSVGACNASLRMANFSSSQRFVRQRDPIVPDMIGPGVDVISAKPGGGFQSMDGTSMATPHIAGLAAVLLEARPGATVARLESAIFRSCKRPPGVTQSRGGRGFPDASRALALL